MAKRTPGPFSAELLDELVEGRDARTALDSGGLIGEIKKALAERIHHRKAAQLGAKSSNGV